MLPYVLLTRYMLPRMKQRTSRSGIINVSSLGGFPPGVPYISTYSGTKAFNLSFSRGLTFEESDKIDVMCLTPSVVESNMSKMKKGAYAIGADECAIGTLNQLGDYHVTEGPWKHALQGSITGFIRSILPTKMHLASIAFMLKQMAKMQKKNI